MTDCSTSSTRTWVRGSTEYLEYAVTANVPLDSQVVEITFDRDTFHTAAWIGDIGTTRTCQVLISDAELPADSAVDVFIRITDTPEIPLIPAGTLTII